MPPRIESIILLYSHSGLCASIQHELLPGGMQLATSFILRNRENSAQGYLLKREGDWWGCVKGDEGDVKLILFSHDKERSEFSVICDAGEREIGAFEPEVSGGYVMQLGHVLACCGRMTWEEAEKDAAKMNEKESKENAEETECKEEIEISVYQGDKDVRKNDLEQSLQRRWPPPPCMPNARYENGIWQDSANC